MRIAHWGDKGNSETGYRERADENWTAYVFAPRSPLETKLGWTMRHFAPDTFRRVTRPRLRAGICTPAALSLNFLASGPVVAVQCVNHQMQYHNARRSSQLRRGSEKD